MVFVQATALRHSTAKVEKRLRKPQGSGVGESADPRESDLIGKDPFRSTAMTTHRRVAYVRVSTEKQRFDRQIQQLEACCDAIRVEQISAVASERPVFDELMRELGPGDTFVVVDLDRAFRSAIDALLTAQSLRERGIGFDMLTFPIDVNSDMGEVFYGILALFAQFERRIIRRRTKEGMDAARRRGVRLGRPTRLPDTTICEAHLWMQSDDLPCRYVAALLGVSRLTLQRGFHRLGLQYPIPSNEREAL